MITWDSPKLFSFSYTLSRGKSSLSVEEKAVSDSPEARWDERMFLVSIMFTKANTICRFYGCNPKATYLVAWQSIERRIFVPFSLPKYTLLLKIVFGWVVVRNKNSISSPVEWSIWGMMISWNLAFGSVPFALHFLMKLRYDVPMTAVYDSSYLFLVSLRMADRISRISLLFLR